MEPEPKINNPGQQLCCEKPFKKTNCHSVASLCSVVVRILLSMFANLRAHILFRRESLDNEHYLIAVDASNRIPCANNLLSDFKLKSLLWIEEAYMHVLSNLKGQCHEKGCSAKALV